MSASKSSVQPPTHAGDDEFPGYRPMSNMAVAGFLFGLASILILINLKYAFIPILGLVFSSLALRRIAALENAVAGRRFALAGLTLSLLFGLAAPTREVIFRWQMRSESRQFAQQWFDALKQRQVYQAHQLRISPAARFTPDALAQRYSQAQARDMLAGFVGEPAIQALLTLGERAQVRYFQQLSLVDSAGRNSVTDTYAVTVDDAGERTTFFVDLALERTKSLVDHTWGWNVHSATFRTTPPPALPTGG